MPIPQLTDDGLLPPGVHDCTLDEIGQVFGRFQRTDRRLALTRRLGDYVELAQRAAIGTHLYVDGSYVTGKEEPGDIDVLLILREDFTLDGPVPPFEYNAQSKKYIKKNFGFDFFFGYEGDGSAEGALRLFRRVKNQPGLEKGILRLLL